MELAIKLEIPQAQITQFRLEYWKLKGQDAPRSSVATCYRFVYYCFLCYLKFCIYIHSNLNAAVQSLFWSLILINNTKPVSSLYFIIDSTLWTLKDNIAGYFATRNILCKKVSTIPTNIVKVTTIVSSNKRFVHAAVIVSSFSVYGSRSFLRLCYNSTFNFDHFLSFFCYCFFNVYVLNHSRIISI